MKANLPSSSRFHVDAVSKLMAILFSGIGILAFDRPTPCAVMFTVLAGLLVVRGVPLRKIIGGLPLVFMVPLCLLIFHALSHPGSRVFSDFILPVTWEGIETGATLFFRVAFVVLASLAFGWTTDIRELMVGLTRLGLSHRAAFVTFLSLRYFPIMRAESLLIRDAARVRRPANLEWRWRLVLWRRCLAVLVIAGIRKAEMTSIAMQLRGFDAQQSRTSLKDFRFTLAGGILLTGVIGLMTLLAVTLK